ncbi:MAG TPA: FHA domain-containing protein [Planctomycetota bacterium]|nr:FHA domain-containing protein [Planctomycetota bacterium]
MPNLRIRDGGREYTFQIEDEGATIGRGDTNDVDLEDAKASKEHFRIERVGSRWKLVDLESKNGTRVNGEFRNKAWLGHGDVLQIGTAEMRFGLEAAARAGREAPPSDRGEEGDEEEAPPRRYQRKNNALLIGLASAVPILLIILVTIFSGGGSPNATVRNEANKLVEEGRYGDAIQYMEQYGDPSYDDYKIIDRRLVEVRERRAAYEKNVREEEARKIFAKVQIFILSYNRGHVAESGPDKIHPLMKQLREKYAGTEASEAAKKEYPAWFALKTPQPASELLAGGGRLQKDWEEAVARSMEYRKEWAFREAKETVERFVTEREDILGAGDLATYEQLRDDELNRIDSFAESVYRGREAEAERLVRAKRYDDAILVYRKVIEKFGIDAWVRRAQAEIGKIEKLKSGG